MKNQEIALFIFQNRLKQEPTMFKLFPLFRLLIFNANGIAQDKFPEVRRTEQINFYLPYLDKEPNICGKSIALFKFHFQ